MVLGAWNGDRNNLILEPAREDDIEAIYRIRMVDPHTVGTMLRKMSVTYGSSGIDHRHLHARESQFYPMGSGRFLVWISFPNEVIQDSVSQLLSVLVGCSIAINEIKTAFLVQIKLPSSVTARFPGPTVGAQDPKLRLAS